jgi:hypothetical protein
MAINFPTSLDVFTDPTSSDQLNLPSHSGQHTDLNNAVEALEAKVGADSSAVTTSHDYKIAQLEARTSGKILQVVSTTKTDTFSATIADTWTDVTGFSVSITPSSASSKILVVANINMSGAYDRPPMRLVRDSTAIGVGDTAGSRLSVSGAGYMLAGADTTTVAVNYLDSPATTSATTYKVQVVVPNSSSTAIYVNRTITDSDSNSYVRSASTITVMEVAA